MKKIISLLLAVITVCALLTGICFADEPFTVHPELATLKVYSDSDPSKAYYFEELDQSVIDWACLNLSGKKVFELLQDFEIYTMSEANLLTVPTTSAKWYNKDLKAAEKFPIVLDLGGHTLTFYGGGNMFYFERFGMDVKNGTLIYHNNAGKTRVPFCLGGTKNGTANSKADACYAPILNLENVHVYSTAGSVVKSYIYDTHINVVNSVLWSAAETNTVIFYKTSQESMSKKWNGPYQPSLTVKNSIIGSNAYYFASGSYEGAKATVEDSIVVSGSTDRPMATTSKVTATYSAEPAKVKDWSFALRDGTTVKGNAYVIGKAPVFLPFTDVKEADWFFPFVKEMYEQKIIAGQTATTFNPGGNLTYGAALKLLTVGVTGKDVGNATSGHWATNYLNEAVKAGWTTIGADKLNSPVTREAFCEIAAKAKNLTEKAENPFKDTTNESVLALVKAGVISGMSADTFNPAGILTRAQIAKIISLLIKL